MAAFLFVVWTLASFSCNCATLVWCCVIFYKCDRTVRGWLGYLGSVSSYPVCGAIAGRSAPKSNSFSYLRIPIRGYKGMWSDCGKVCTRVLVLALRLRR
ncbi:uncharacterized protein EI90DRAFT_3036304 [Cantharellus anzutake]|uniref:uncharacterized protein n=1 Tax=Cantharellus anzutake TaxID=1750568 RepID=UPI001906E2D8|nr:uncharacterized protein EI90DRAFT_3036304 [Cantharellus anzutake]KAF8340641.1 hypothetical protein EI90DRAFT_3036304 [Cantharellus anzutake]